MGVNIGPRIGVQGEAEYRKQINNIIQQAKTLASEMKTVTSSFDKNTTSQKKASSAAQVLSKQVDVQKQRVSLLTDMYKKSVQALGETDTKTLKWKQALNEAAAELNRLEQSLDDASKGVGEFGDSAEDAGEKALSLGDIIKANVISDAITTGLQKVVDLGKKIGEAFADAAKQSLEAYGDYEQLTGGIKKLFGDAYSEVAADAQEAYKTSGLSANDYMETVTGFSASLISDLGGDTQKAAELANTAITDMADNANTFGTDIESAQNAYQGFAKQTYTMLDNLRLGYGGTQEEMARLINDSGVLGDTIEVTASTVNDVSFDKIIEAIHVVQEQMGITGTTSKEAATTIQGSVSSMKAAWKNMLVAFAADDMDVSAYVDNFVESVKTAADNIIPRAKKIVPNLVEGITEIATELSPYVAEAVEELAPVIGEGLSSILSAASPLWKAVQPSIVESAKTLGGYLLEGLGEGIKAFAESSPIATAVVGALGIATIVAKITAAASALAPVFSTVVAAINPLTLVIAAVVAAGALLIANWDKVSAWAKETWGTVKETVSTVGESVKEKVSNLGTNIKTKWNSMTTDVKNKWNTTWTDVKEKAAAGASALSGKWNEMKTTAGTAWSNIKTTVSTGAKSAAENIKAGIQGALTYLQGLPGKALSWGMDFMNGFADGIVSAATAVVNSVKRIASKISSYLHFSRPDTGPLRDYEAWMPDMIDGMVSGINANAYKLENALQNMTSGMAINTKTGSTGAAQGRQISINVYGAQGQSEEAIANLVMQKLQHQVSQREAVWA